MRNISKNEIFPSDLLKPSLVLFTKCCTFCFFILLIFISSSVVFAATIFVPGDYDTIQGAINASSTGDTVSVADGTYYENILFFPPSKTISLISENGAELTVIEGALPEGDPSGSVVTFATGNNSTLDGFTITNGSTSGNGGGIRIGRDASPTIANCIITDNVAYAGGGISCGDSSAPLITNSIIEYNSVTGIDAQSNGGGIHASPFSTPTITNCIIQNNTSGNNGGGMAFNNADEPWIVNCIFSNNTAAVNGGAISFKNSAPIITNCTFSNNSASGNGGAIACSTPLSGTAVANSILWGDNPNEIACNSATIPVTYSVIQGEPTWPGTGNINADPKFVDEESGDFHLLNDSPCIDAGDNSALALQATDIDGDDRKIDDPAVADTGNGTPPIVDIGAYEFINDTLTTTTTTLPSGPTTTTTSTTTTTTTLPSENFVSPGKNVETNPGNNVSLIFDEVTTGGTCSSATASTPTPPDDFRLVGQNFDISCTVTFNGVITVCLGYDDDDINGNEADIQLMHRNVDGSWLDITIDRDAVNNTICSQTGSFSEFAIFEPVVAPVADEGGGGGGGGGCFIATALKAAN